MKKNILSYAALALAAGVGLSSCSDEFLQDKKNYDNANVEIYNYYEGANGRLNDIYSWCLPAVNDASWKYPSMGNADICAKSTEEYSGFSDFVNPQIELSTMSSTNAVPDFTYGTRGNIQEMCYGRIRNVNDAIINVSNSTLEQSKKDIILGQLYFFRAWCYYNLVKWYGGVQIITDMLEPVESTHVPRSSAKDCIDFILKDLNNSAQMLAEKTKNGTGWGGSDYGRVTTGTALALKGRVLQLWASPLFNRKNDMSRWTDAYNQMKPELAAIDSCGYHLYQTTNNVNGSDFAAMFLQQTQNPEAVFVTLYNNITGDGLDNQKNNRWERDIRPSNTGGGGKGASATMVNLFPMADGMLPSNIDNYSKLQKSPVDYTPETPFLNRDPRFYRTFAFPGFRWAYNGDASMKDPHNPADGKNFTIWNYVWYTEKNDEGNPESGNSYGADNLLSSKQAVYIRKKSDDLDVNSSPLYQYVALDSKGAAPFYSGAQLIELRYAEVLLNFAEVACMAGHTDEAVQYLDMVRTRAGLPAGCAHIANKGDKASVMSAILYERQIEFAYEGKRFDDMRRWMLFDGGQGTVDGAPASWKLSGEITNTCEWLGVKPFNGQRRENMEFHTKYIGGTTYDSDGLATPIYEQLVESKMSETGASRENIEKQYGAEFKAQAFKEAMAKRPDGVDFRKADIVSQLQTLAEWYSKNLTWKEKRGDGYDSNHNLLYINFRPNYYFLGIPMNAATTDKQLQQTLGWGDYNNGGANGTFDPLAE